MFGIVVIRGGKKRMIRKENDYLRKLGFVWWRMGMWCMGMGLSLRRGWGWENGWLMRRGLRVWMFERDMNWFRGG